MNENKLPEHLLILEKIIILIYKTGLNPLTSYLTNLVQYDMI